MRKAGGLTNLIYAETKNENGLTRKFYGLVSNCPKATNIFCKAIKYFNKATNFPPKHTNQNGKDARVFIPSESRGNDRILLGISESARMISTSLQSSLHNACRGHDRRCFPIGLWSRGRVLKR